MQDTVVTIANTPHKYNNVIAVVSNNDIFANQNENTTTIICRTRIRA